MKLSMGPIYLWSVSSSLLSWSFTTSKLGVCNMYRLLYKSYKFCCDHALQQYLFHLRLIAGFITKGFHQKMKFILKRTVSYQEWSFFTALSIVKWHLTSPFTATNTFRRSLRVKIYREISSQKKRGWTEDKLTTSWWFS